MASHYDKNTQEVIRTAILAKAAICRSPGQYEVIVVFEKSTRYEFYWIFKARTPRSPRRSWKPAGYYARDIESDAKPYRDFGSFVDHYARLRHAQVLSLRMPQARRLAGLLVKTEHESVGADWTPRDESKMTYHLVVKKSNAFKPRGGYFANRDRFFDSLPIDPDCVLVYEDFCKECGKNHSIAHWPSGSVKCMGYAELKNNPSLIYKGFNGRIFKFQFTTAG